MFGLQGDPISNRKVQLDGTLICSLLGCYLRGDPANSAYVMPSFRVKQLVERIQCTHGDNGMFHGPIDPNMMEVVGCLYILCMYLAITPNLDAETAFDCARCVHMALGESLQIMHEDKKQRLHFLHPYSLFNKDNAYGVYDAFKASLHSAKDIVRELTKQIRICRESKTAEDTKFDKLDCWQAHSIYFMCAFGLCHFSGVLKSTNNMNMIPGQIESLVLIASLVPKPHSTSAETVKLFKEENTRFYLLLEHTLNMGRVMVHFCIDDRTIQEVHVHKQHFMKAITNPSCDYSRLKGLIMKAFLGTPNPNLLEDEVDLLSKRHEFYDILIVGSEDDTPSWYHHKPEKESDKVRDYGEFVAPSNEEFVSLTSKPGTRGTSPGTRGETRGSMPGIRGETRGSVPGTRGETRGSMPGTRGKTRESVPGTLGETRGTDKSSTRGKLSTAGSMKPMSSKKDDSSDKHSDDVKESNGCWRLRKYYRPAFMSTRFFRKGVHVNHNLSAHNLPKKMFTKTPYDFYSAKGLSLMPLSRALKTIDSIVYYSDDMGMCPRYLNPDKGLFWGCVYVIDYIYQATFYGGGFSTDERSQTKKLRTEVKIAKTEIQKHLPAVKKTALSPIHTKNGGKSPSSKAKGVGDLLQRLSLVAREAQAEAELDTIAAIRKEKKRIDNLKGPKRMQQVDEVLKQGTRVMRSVAAEQSDLFADLYGDQNMYSDTDDDDDYTADEDEDEDEETATEDGGTEDGGSEANSTPGSSRRTSESTGFNPFDASDPFTQLDLMQQNRLNDKGQAMDEARYDDPLQSYLSEPALHQINNFRKKLKKSGVVKAGKKNLIENGNRASSVVWTMRQTKQNDSTVRRINAGKMDSSELAILYVEDIKKYQKERNDERLAQMQELEDVQEMEISKTRAFKLGMVHEAREERRVRALESAAIVSKKADDNARSERLARQAQRLEEKYRDERNRSELARINDIAVHKQEKEQRMKVAQEGRAAIEAIRLREMEEAKEYREIIRRYQEEYRMKQLEERRHYLENREALDAAAEQEKLNDKRTEFKKEKKIMSRRLRAGNFMQKSPDGKKGFYDDIREKTVDWIQYHDEYGKPYYYDPILKTYSYDVPHDADFHHHSVDDRRDYDAIHGEGAYDEHFWNAQMMESVNNGGGYYDKEGQWQEVNGMYTEDGTFLNFDEGYLDEQGNWNLYPTVSGNLDFMV